MKTITQENKDQINSAQHASNIVEQDLQARADKYEDDRIGQGVTSKLVGVLAQVPTIGHGGAINVGGPNSKEKSNIAGGNIKPLKPSGEE